MRRNLPTWLNGWIALRSVSQECSKELLVWKILKERRIIFIQFAILLNRKERTSNGLCSNLTNLCPTGMVYDINLFLVTTLISITCRADSDGLSEQKRLEGLITRYKSMIPMIESTMMKIDLYSKSYSFRDEIQKVI